MVRYNRRMAVSDSTHTYRWPAGGLIERIDIRQQSNGRAVAYLYADESEEARPARQELRALLRMKGWGTLSDNREGKYALRISGFANSNDLLEVIRNSPHYTANPTVEPLTDKTPKQSVGESVRANTLRGAGIFYSLGNLIYLASGVLRNREQGTNQHGQIGSALVWGAGDALIATVGGRDDSRQFSSLVSKLKGHYERSGIEIPKTAAIHSETNMEGRSIGSRLHDFIYEHVNQLKCASEALAAVFYFRAGHEQGNFWKQVTAVIFGTGFTASLLIPERKIDQEKYDKAGALGKLWMKVQAQPLSVGGISGFSNTILTTVSAHGEGRRFNNPSKYPTLPNKSGQIIAPSKYYKLDYAAPAVMFFGNSLYAMSKKTTGGDIKADAMVSDVYIVAAQILNKQPDNVRESAIESTADFLGKRPEIKDTKLEIVERLKHEMDVQRNSPWFEKTPLTNYTPTPKKSRMPLHRLEQPTANDDEPTTTVQTGAMEHAPLAPALQAGITA